MPLIWRKQTATPPDHWGGDQSQKEWKKTSIKYCLKCKFKIQWSEHKFVWTFALVFVCVCAFFSWFLWRTFGRTTVVCIGIFFACQPTHEVNMTQCNQIFTIFAEGCLVSGEISKQITNKPTGSITIYHEKCYYICPTHTYSFEVVIVGL